jgi:hypothetical protein
LLAFAVFIRSSRGGWSGRNEAAAVLLARGNRQHSFEDGETWPRYNLIADQIHIESMISVLISANGIHVSATTWKLLVRYGKGFILTPGAKST